MRERLFGGQCAVPVAFHNTVALLQRECCNQAVLGTMHNCTVVNA